MELSRARDTRTGKWEIFCRMKLSAVGRQQLAEKLIAPASYG